MLLFPASFYFNPAPEFPGKMPARCSETVCAKTNLGWLSLGIALRAPVLGALLSALPKTVLPARARSHGARLVD